MSSVSTSSRPPVEWSEPNEPVADPSTVPSLCGGGDSDSTTAVSSTLSGSCCDNDEVSLSDDECGTNCSTGHTSTFSGGGAVAEMEKEAGEKRSNSLCLSLPSEEADHHNTTGEEENEKKSETITEESIAEVLLFFRTVQSVKGTWRCLEEVSFFFSFTLSLPLSLSLSLLPHSLSLSIPLSLTLYLSLSLYCLSTPSLHLLPCLYLTPLHLHPLYPFPLLLSSPSFKIKPNACSPGTMIFPLLRISKAISVRHTLLKYLCWRERERKRHTLSLPLHFPLSLPLPLPLPLPLLLLPLLPLQKKSQKNHPLPRLSLLLLSPLLSTTRPYSKSVSRTVVYVVFIVVWSLLLFCSVGRILPVQPLSLSWVNHFSTTSTRKGKISCGAHLTVVDQVLIEVVSL